jgi:hypothetical protein
MYNDGKIENLVKQILAALPVDLRQAKADMEKNLKAIISAGLVKMDLVTREEFDVQAELLARTRASLEKIQRHLTELEEKTSRKK